MTEYGSGLKATWAIDKGLIHSQASHVEAREDHVLHQAFQFIKKGFMNHIVQVKKIDSHLWDMRRYRRFKPHKWPKSKPLKSAKFSKDSVSLNSGTYTGLPVQSKDQANRMEPDQEADPFTPSGFKRSTRINPVHVKAHFHDNFENDPHNQQSTKSSDEIRGNSGHQPTKTINTGHPEEVIGLYNRGYNDLPFEPRDLRGQINKDKSISQRYPQNENALFRANTQANLHNEDHRLGNKAHGIQLPGVGINEEPYHHVRGNSSKPLQLKENNQSGNFTPQAKHSGVGLGGFALGTPAWSNPHTFKRSDTNYNPATSHLDHFGNPYYRKQKSSVAEFGPKDYDHRPISNGIQLKPQPTSSGHNFFAQAPQNSSKEAFQKRGPMFDEDDLSIFLDERYKILENKEVQMNGTLNLDDSMVQDLNALNKLLKARPH